MKILFDQGTPVPLRRHLHPHDVDTAAERNWSTLQNGDLLNAADDDGYHVLVTTDQNLRYQQNLADRQIGILVLCTTSWPRIRENIEQVVAALDALPEGGYHELRF
ncbi:MAG: hypothetical protein HQ523_10225 [Lentisphaerae bacterium]|nr:hypothetical protein [Lentisphaerota bacterium]